MKDDCNLKERPGSCCCAKAVPSTLKGTPSDTQDSCCEAAKSPETPDECHEEGRGETGSRGHALQGQGGSCACGPAVLPPHDTTESGAGVSKLRYFGIGAAALAIWFGLYVSIVPLSQWLTYGALSLAQNTPMAAAVEFFVYDTAKILLLLVLMVYLLAWLRATLNVERVRDYLAGKGHAVGYMAGAGFGAITPFCSCSSIPLFLGFTTARIPIGITMSFLITSPLVNEVAVVLLWGLLGWKFTVVYVTVGILAGIASGIIMDALRAERWLQPFLLEAMQHTPVQSGGTGENRQSVSLMQRHMFAWGETRAITRRVWLWVLVGVGLGAALHGFVPQTWFEEHLGAGQWWSVPLAVAVGIPLYTNVTGIIPIMESLLLKGLPVGTTLAFCMSTVAASLPELLMLKQVMRWRLLVLFLAILLVIFTLVGWFFNATQGLIF